MTEHHLHSVGWALDSRAAISLQLAERNTMTDAPLVRDAGMSAIDV